jgi:uncharacterized protein (DUF1919 family)
VIPELAHRTVLGLLRRRAEMCARRDSRINLRVNEFSIVSDDCWGGEIYRLTNSPFASPFIGMIITPRNYMRILRDLPAALKSSLVQLERSSDADAEHERQQFPLGPYPVGLLVDVDAEILFMHYASWDEAYDKWLRRRGRVNLDDPLIKIGTHRNSARGVDQVALREFARLPFTRKLAVAESPVARINTAVSPYHYDTLTRLHHGATRFDHVAWLNGSDGQVSPMQRWGRTVKYGGWR